MNQAQFNFSQVSRHFFWKSGSFRQFDPSKDANKRKAVILDFFDGVRLWAQYAEGNTALSEWEIFSDDYRVEKSGSEYRIYFDAPRSVQILPTQCDNCIETSGISISIRDLFDSEKIRFKLNIDNSERRYSETWSRSERKNSEIRNLRKTSWGLFKKSRTTING